jgi:hypothetical protein
LYLGVWQLVAGGSLVTNAFLASKLGDSTGAVVILIAATAAVVGFVSTAVQCTSNFSEHKTHDEVSSSS